MQKLKLGVIGTGSVVREIYQHLYFNSEYSDQISVEAAVNRSPESLNTFCDQHHIPADRRFSSYQAMIDAVELDAVQVNTPDNLHEAPTIYALDHGLDVLVPKPLTDKIDSAHRMIKAMQKSGRLIGVDFHKRDDPRIKECQARYESGTYGRFQLAVWYMLDKLSVADPNHTPRFFASPNFAKDNSPISFLTVHMADAFMRIINLRPTHVSARAWSQKLPTLSPIPVQGYDMVDTQITFENGGVAHIITGWHLPNTAHSTTVQSSRIICTDGYIDLNLDMPGYRQVTKDGIVEHNPLFRNYQADGTVTGYGMSRPGRLLQKMAKHRAGQLSSKELALLHDPFELGFWTAVVCEAAEHSLTIGHTDDQGITVGKEVLIANLLKEKLGDEAGVYL